MIRQTGGSALGATSTRSSSCSRACVSAWGRGRTPSCSPSAPTRKTSRARMRSLILTSCAAMWSPASFAASSVGGGTGSGPGRDDGGHGNVRHQTTADKSGCTTCGPGAPSVLLVIVLVARWGHCTQARGPKSRFPLPCYAGRDRISCQDTRVSSIWTPSGEHQPDPGPEPRAPAPAGRVPPGGRTGRDDPGAVPGADPGPGRAGRHPRRRHRGQPRDRAPAARRHPPPPRSRHRRQPRPNPGWPRRAWPSTPSARWSTRSATGWRRTTKRSGKR